MPVRSQLLLDVRRRRHVISALGWPCTNHIQGEPGLGRRIQQHAKPLINAVPGLAKAIQPQAGDDKAASGLAHAKRPTARRRPRVQASGTRARSRKAKVSWLNLSRTARHASKMACP